MTDKELIKQEIERLHELLPVMDGDNVSINYAETICTALEEYIDSLPENPNVKNEDSSDECPCCGWVLDSDGCCASCGYGRK